MLQSKTVQAAATPRRAWLMAGATAAVALAAMAFSGGAQARGDVSFSIGFGVPGVHVGVGNVYPVYSQPVFVHPEPVYYPQPVYVQPQPVYVQPRPVYVPRPVYYERPPVYYQPAPVYYRGGHHRGHGYGHGDKHRGRHGGHGGYYR